MPSEDEMIARAIGDNPYDPRPVHTRAFDRIQARQATDRQTRAYTELEADFQQRVTDLADAHGWDWQHCRQPQEDRPGFPDLVLWHPGRGLVLFRELKRDGGKLTHAQAWCGSLPCKEWAGANAERLVPVRLAGNRGYPCLRVGSHQTQHRSVSLTPRPVAVQPGPHVSHEALRALVFGQRLAVPGPPPRVLIGPRFQRQILFDGHPIGIAHGLGDGVRYAGLNPSVAFQVVRFLGVSSGHSENVQVRRTIPDGPSAVGSRGTSAAKSWRETGASAVHDGHPQPCARPLTKVNLTVIGLGINRHRIPRVPRVEHQQPHTLPADPPPLACEPLASRVGVGKPAGADHGVGARPQGETVCLELYPPFLAADALPAVEGFLEIGSVARLPVLHQRPVGGAAVLAWAHWQGFL